MMSQKLLVSFVLMLLIAGCSNTADRQQNHQPTDYQVVTALGDTLYTLPVDEETKAQLNNELEAARAAYDANPEDIKATISYGRQTANTGNYQEAIQIFSKGIQQHPESRQLYLYRGKQHIKVRHFDAAIEDLKHVTELIFGKKDTAETNKDTSGKQKSNGSLSTNTWYQLGLAYYMKGAFKKAKNAFEESLRWASD